MAIDSILAEIDAEIARLTQARKLLAGATGIASLTKQHKKAASGSKAKRRVLSPEARKRIADAQRRRWAAQKSKAKKES